MIHFILDIAKSNALETKYTTFGSKKKRASESLLYHLYLCRSEVSYLIETDISGDIGLPKILG